MKVLITGVNGFAGRHMAELSAGRKDVELFGLSLQSDPRIKGLRFFACDLLDGAKVKRVIRSIRPDRVFHLAGQAFVPLSVEDPRQTFECNVIGQLNLFEALRTLPSRPLIHVASSAAVYGTVYKRELPIKESQALRPSSPYAVSKVTQEYLSYQYGSMYGFRVVCTRAFSHIGPGQDQRFAASCFARQIALIEAGRQKPILRVGDLSHAKDFTDVRDMVNAYWLCLEKGTPGEIYNICSGQAYTMKQVLDILLEHASVNVKVEGDPNRFRSYDMPVLVGNSASFKRATGWKPRHDIRQTLKEILGDWREIIRAHKA